jgi:hypothetical protein
MVVRHIAKILLWKSFGYGVRVVVVGSGIPTGYAFDGRSDPALETPGYFRASLPGRGYFSRQSYLRQIFLAQS